MSSYPSILEPLFVQHDGIGASEVRNAGIGTEAHRPPETGARLLMRAVLRDAILCLQGVAPDVSGKLRQRAAAEARLWILSRNVTYAFSFVSICDVLGLDADGLRSRLLGSLPASGREGSAPAMERRQLVRNLRRARMRGNTRTKVVARRVRRTRAQTSNAAPIDAAAVQEGAR